MHSIKAAGSVTLKIGGSLTMSGSHVTFQCGGSKVSSSPSGLLIEASEIKIAKPSKQSGKTTHG
jgi:type VI secretion system secreted protein VgrG